MKNKFTPTTLKMLLVLLVFLGGIWFAVNDPTITGRIVTDEISVIELNGIYTSNSSEVLEITEVPLNLKTSGSFKGEGKASIWLKAGSEKLLVAEIIGGEVDSSSGNLITGLVSGEINLSNNESESNATTSENETNTTVPEINETVNESLNESVNVTVPEINETINESLNVTVNDTDTNVTIEDNETVNETVEEESDSGSGEKDTEKVVEEEEPVIEETTTFTFSDVCEETCELGTIAGPYKLIIEIEGEGELILDDVSYSYSNPIKLSSIKDVPELFIDNETTIDLTEYFEGEGIYFDMKSSQGYTYDIQGDVVIVTPLQEGTWSSLFYAYKDGAILESNEFNITINLSMSSIVEELKTKLKDVKFKDLKEKEGKYELEVEDLVNSNNKLKINGIKDTKEIKGIKFVKKDKDPRITTDIIYVDSLEITDATIQLSKFADTTAIATCTDYNPNSNKCKEWVETELEFNDYEDYIEFNVEHFSAYAGIIEITDAEHLDENRTLIENIYEYVNESDNYWSPQIYHNEYVRVTFEQELTSINDITFYARNNESTNTTVYVYEKDGSTVLIEYPIINSSVEEYKEFLTNLSGTQGTFDLKIVDKQNNSNAYLEFDYIIDPPYYLTSNSLSTSKTLLNESMTVNRTNLTASITTDSNKGIWALALFTENLAGTNTTIDGTCGANDPFRVTAITVDGSTCATGTVSTGVVDCNKGTAATANQIWEIETCADANSGSPFTIYSNCTGSGPNDACTGFPDNSPEITVYKNKGPWFTTNLSANETEITAGATINYTATGTDTETDNYILVVCDASGISDGYPGTCSGGNNLCNSTATTATNEASCLYTTTTDETLNAYGYLCDAGSTTCNQTSTTDSVTVNPLFGYLNVSLQYPTTDLTVNQYETFDINATITCSGDALAKCGTVYASARYDDAGYKLINATTGGTPLYISGQTSSYCYQETANESHALDGNCTLNYTGEYAWDDQWDPSQPAANTIDGSLATYGWENGGTTAYLYMNYSKPEGAGNDSYWQVYSYTQGLTNLSIPPACWDYNDTILLFRMISSTNSPFGRHECYSGSWTTLISDTLGARIYEEGMQWQLGTSVSNPQSSSETLELDESYNFTWTVNASGSTGFSYPIDVLFNSSYGNANVPDNDTTDKSICIGACENSPPYTPTVSINSTDGTNLTTQDLNCWATIDGYDAADTINVTVKWYDDGALAYEYNDTSEYAKGTQVNYTLDSANTTDSDTWICGITLVDKDGSSEEGNSTGLPINLTLVVSNVILNATSSDNLYSDNLTLFFSQLDNQDNVTDWRVDGTSIAILNMPFNTNISDETGPYVKDYSTYTNNGTLGGGTAGYRPTWNATGKIGGAYTFDGYLDFIEIADPGTNSVLDFSNEDNITLMAWIDAKEMGLNNDDYIISKGRLTGSSTNQNYGLRATTDLNITHWFISFIYRDSTDTNWHRWEALENISENTGWHHVALTYTFGNGTSIKAYMDGTLVDGEWNLGNGSEAPYEDNSDLWIGSALGGLDTYTVDGSLDDVQIINRSLSAEQINTIYQAGLNNHSVDIIVSNETKIGEQWSSCITLSDTSEDGPTTCSENITIQENITVEGWWDNSFGKCRNITVENVGSTELTDFPAYINLTKDPNMQSGYNDVRFVSTSCNSTGIQLKHELESYDSERAEYWVKIPTLTASGNTTISVYYSNSTVSNGDDSTNVWDSYFFGVWHLNESSGSTAQDSTSNNKDGTFQDNLPTSDSILVGGAQNMDGDTDKITTALNRDTLNGLVTIEGWVKLHSTSGYGAIMGSTTDNNQILLTRNYQGGASGGWEGVIQTSGSLEKAYQGSAGDLNLHYVVMTVNSTHIALFIDGEQINVSTQAVGLPGTSNTFGIGIRDYITDDMFLNGSIDEVRISNESRSGDWINETYNLIKNQDTYVTIGSEESYLPVIPPTTPTPTINTTDGSNSTDENITCSDVIDSNNLPMNVTVRWYKNGGLNLTINYNNSYADGTTFNATLDSANTSGEDIWYCSFRLYDGEEFSEWGNSANLEINPTRPVTPTPTLNTTSGSNITTQDLECSSTIKTRRDGTELNVTVNWYKDNNLNLTIDYNNSYSNNTVFNTTLNSENTTKGDSWVCGIIISDGVEYSYEGNSSGLSVTNAEPTATARASPQSPLTNQSLLGYCNSTDEDDEPQAYAWKWYQDDSEFNSSVEFNNCLTGTVTGHYTTVNNNNGTCTITIQPNATYGNATYITDENANYNYGSTTKLTVYVDNGAGRKERPLIKFDLTNVPNVTILDSKLTFTTISSPADTITTTAYRLLVNWDEGSNEGSVGQASWVYSTEAQDNLWSGGQSDSDYDSTVLDSVDVDSISEYTLNLLNTTRGWINGSYTNYGVMLIGTSSTDGTWYSIRSDDDTLYRPKLEITYETYNTTDTGVEVNLNNISSDNTTEGETWIFSCLVHDGTTNSSWVNSTLLTIAGENNAPDTPSPSINSTDGTNLTTQDLNCWATITDTESDPMNVTVKWYKDNALTLTIDYNNSYANNTVFNATLDSANTTVTDIWICGITLTDDDGSSNEGNSTGLTITSAETNSEPMITFVEAPSSLSPKEGADKLANITFTAYDADGNNTINTSTIQIKLTLGSVTRTNTSCMSTELSAEELNITCNVSMKYYDAAGSWSINVSISDNAGAYAENTTQSITYNELSAISLSTSSIDFGTISIGTENTTTTPININNTGNVNFSFISLKAYDLVNDSNIISSGNFNINKSNSSIGDILQNDTYVNITDASLDRSTDSQQSNQTAFIYVDIPNVPLASAIYNSISSWIVLADT